MQATYIPIADLENLPEGIEYQQPRGYVSYLTLLHLN